LPAEIAMNVGGEDVGYVVFLKKYCQLIGFTLRKAMFMHATSGIKKRYMHEDESGTVMPGFYQFFLEPPGLPKIKSKFIGVV